MPGRGSAAFNSPAKFFIFLLGIGGLLGMTWTRAQPRQPEGVQQLGDGALGYRHGEALVDHPLKIGEPGLPKFQAVQPPTAALRLALSNPHPLQTCGTVRRGHGIAMQQCFRRGILRLRCGAVSHPPSHEESSTKAHIDRFNRH